MPLIPSALVDEADSTEQMSDRRTIVQDLRPLDGKHSTTQYSSLREVNMDGYRYPKAPLSSLRRHRTNPKNADTNRRIVTRQCLGPRRRPRLTGPAREPPLPRFASIFCPDWAVTSENPAIQQPPTVSADAACTGHTVFARNAPWPKDVGHRPRPRLSKLFQVPRSRDVLCVVSHHPKPSRSSSGYPPDVTSMFRAGSELDPPCSGDLLT